MTLTSTSRPANRKTVILQTAAKLFAEHGFAAVTMSQIADAVGITAGALYRHYPGKLALLEESLRGWFAQIAATGAESLDELIATRSRTAVELIGLGALWTRESRHLDAATHADFRATIRAQTAVYGDAVRQRRDDLSVDDARFLALALQSILSSPTTGLRGLGSKRYAELLADISHRIIAAELPAEDARPRLVGPGLQPSTRREALLVIAEHRFGEDGYEATSLADIATDAGIRGPSIYSYFPSKSDIQDELLARAAAGLWLTLTGALARAKSHRDALRAAARSYVKLTVSRPGLLSALITHRAFSTDSSRTQHDYIAEWVALLAVVHPQLTAAEAHATVRAAVRLINDLARTPSYARRRDARARITALVFAVLDVA